MWICAGRIRRSFWCEVHCESTPLTLHGASLLGALVNRWLIKKFGERCPRFCLWCIGLIALVRLLQFTVHLLHEWWWSAARPTIVDLAQPTLITIRLIIKVFILKTLVTCHNPVFERWKLIRDSNCVLFDHSLLVEGLYLLAAKVSVVLTVKFSLLHNKVERLWNLFFWEVVNQICYERSSLFLLVQHAFDKVSETIWVLGNRLGLFVNNWIEQGSDVVFVKWWLKARHRVQGNP